MNPTAKVLHNIRLCKSERKPLDSWSERPRGKVCGRGGRWWQKLPIIYSSWNNGQTQQKDLTMFKHLIKINEIYPRFHWLWDAEFLADKLAFICGHPLAGTLMLLFFLSLAFRRRASSRA